MKKILVLISTYNGEKYLKEQLESIRAQRGVEVRILVRDDGSKDNTINLLKDFSKSYPSLIEDVISGNNVGSTASFSELMRVAYEDYSEDFQYYAFADQDDFWLEDKLNRAMLRLKDLDETKPNMYCSNKIIVDSNLNKIEGILSPKIELTKGRALARNIATGCTMVFNKRALELFATHKTEYIKIHDHAIFLICTFLGNVIYDNEAFILYRQHGHNQLGGMDTFKDRMRDRLRKKGKLNEHLLERTAKAFKDAYHDLLSEEDIKLIQVMSSYRDGFSNRLRLFFNKDISKERFEENVFFKLKVLLGGV